MLFGDLFLANFKLVCTQIIRPRAQACQAYEILRDAAFTLVF
jgi:hypothetical protein